MALAKGLGPIALGARALAELHFKIQTSRHVGPLLMQGRFAPLAKGPTSLHNRILKTKLKGQLNFKNY